LPITEVNGKAESEKRLPAGTGKWEMPKILLVDDSKFLPLASERWCAPVMR
jgi:hypothetical protein